MELYGSRNRLDFDDKIHSVKVAQLPPCYIIFYEKLNF